MPIAITRDQYDAVHSTSTRDHGHATYTRRVEQMFDAYFSSALRTSELSSFRDATVPALLDGSPDSRVRDFLTPVHPPR